MTAQRVALLALLALLVALADVQLALTLAPALLVAALPLSGVFPGEALIAARRVERAPVPRRPLRTRWPRPVRAVAASLLERSPRSLRGPPLPA